MEFGRAFSFVFEDPDWLKKVGIAALVFLIPIIGQIVLMGWGLEITRRVINHDPTTLPDWSNFSDFLLKGFHAFVVSLVYTLPGILVIICGQLLLLGVASSVSDSNSNTVGVIVTAATVCMICFVSLFFIAAGFVIPAATGNLAATGELSAAFRFNEVLGLVRAAPGPYVMVILGVLLASIILAPVGALVCGIGVLITTAYTTALSGHLTGQAYNAAKAVRSQV